MAGICMCVWCMHIWVHRDVSHTHRPGEDVGSPTLSFSALTPRISFSMKLELSWQPASPAILLSLSSPPQHWGHRCIGTSPAFWHWLWEFELSCPCAERVLTSWAISPALPLSSWTSCFNLDLAFLLCRDWRGVRQPPILHRNYVFKCLAYSCCYYLLVKSVLFLLQWGT